ncbi:uncharacterized protein ISCGN_011754 [Ixodes scapularis]
MATIGRFDQFIEDGDEDFESYVERFEHFLKASKLVQTLRGHYVPKPSVIAERFRFNRRFQQEGETVAAFAVELKRLAASCDFGAFLDEALRDRFVAGLCDRGTQAELLKKSKLTFKNACDIARSIELASQESRDLQPSVGQETVSALRHKPDSGKRPPRRREVPATVPAGARATKSPDCFRCGSAHEASSCKFRKYRNTPTTTTGQTPAELFLSWKPRTRLTLLQPDLERRIADRFSKIKSQADDRRGPWRSFEEGERVIVQGLRPGEAKWLPGVIEKRCSAVTYIVRVGRGTRFVHAENLRPRYFESDEQGSREPSCVVPSSIPDRVPEASATSPPLPALESPKAAAAPPEPPEDSAPLGQRNASPRQGSAPQSPLREPDSPQGAQTLRRSARARKPPDWYTP